MALFSIREEQTKDVAGIRRVNREAFGRESEVRLVDRLRDSGLVVASLVAVENGGVIGHILFSRLPIEGGSAILQAAALAPMSVAPSRQRQGIGSALVRRGLDLCRERGFAVALVVGHIGYYPRFGFSAEKAKCISSVYSGPHFMALELAPRALEGVVGLAAYPAAFAEVSVRP